jgi:signal transduction histidine kinase
MSPFRSATLLRAANTALFLICLAALKDRQIVDLSPAFAALGVVTAANLALAWLFEDLPEPAVGGLAFADLGAVAFAALWAKNPAVEPHLAMLIPLAVASRRLPWPWTTGLAAASMAATLWLGRETGTSFETIPYRIAVLAMIPFVVGLIGASLSRQQSEKVRHRIALNRSVLFHEFLSHLLFQVREYLTSITSVSQHMPKMVQDEKAKELAEKLARMVHELNSKVGRMFETVESHTTTRRPAQAVDFDLGKLLRDASALATEAYPVRKPRSKIWVDPAIPPIQGDRDMYFAIFSAVFENALEAMSETKRGTQLNASARHNPQKDLAEVEIIDDAGGIPPGDVGRVLTPLFTTKSRVGGVGLGLSMSRRMLEHIGGTIQIRSDNGRTFVRVVLPLKPGLPMIRNEESTWAGRRAEA